MRTFQSDTDERTPGFRGVRLPCHVNTPQDRIGNRSEGADRNVRPEGTGSAHLDAPFSRPQQWSVAGIGLHRREFHKAGSRQRSDCRGNGVQPAHCRHALPESDRTHDTGRNPPAANRMRETAAVRQKPGSCGDSRALRLPVANDLHAILQVCDRHDDDRMAAQRGAIATPPQRPARIVPHRILISVHTNRCKSIPAPNRGQSPPDYLAPASPASDASISTIAAATYCWSECFYRFAHFLVLLADFAYRHRI